MSLFKTAFYATLAAGIFYSGMKYERSCTKDLVFGLKSKIEEMSTLDYKIRSLVDEKASDSEKVDLAFKKYQNMVR